MKNLIKKILQADNRAHHHTALVLTGLFLSGFMAFWQLFMPQMQTHAANLVCGTASNIAVPVSECQALVDLYTYTNGDTWTNNTNWNTDTNICLWEGIGCTPADGSGFAHVQIIDLDENNLNGSVPQTIGNLPYLTSVALYRNNNLVVNLEIFQGLTGLQWLSAYNTNLQGNFDALSGLTDIRELSLSCRDTFAQCDVTGNLDTVSGMMYIYGLSVDGLGLEGTLDPIYDKYLLQNLDLDGNSISGPIGAAFGGLTGLVDIEMSNNQLNGSIPVEIGNLINATELSISNNQLTGPIPEEIGNLTNLQILNLANNEFDSVPSTLSNLTNLTYLGLARNKIEGEFPVDFNGWNNLQTIWMGDNTGMVVNIDAFADLGTSVQNITIDNTMLTGTISSLSGLIGLTDLNMACWNTPCDVDGLINDLGNLTAMQNISIQNAGVGGTLDDLYNLSQLQTFRLNGNSIGGTLGAGVANWTVLIKLELQDNLFTGALPAELGQLTQLQFLNLAGNNFNGELPDLDGFYQINSIYLGGNNWVGTLPSSWGDLTTLTTINVGGNSLSASYLHGNLPSSWGNLTNLQRLDIQFTSITGSLPESWGNWTNLGRLTLFYNDLTGPIPDSYSGFLLNNSMERFWLNNNHLDGDLPTWFGDVTSYGKIEANCLDTDHLDSDAQSNLDEYFTNWDAQSNCLPDVRLSTRIVGDITPGNVVDYYIDYENIGEQRAANLIISQDFADGISIVTDYSSGSDGLISADYFVSEDACYSDMLYNGEGPYADYLANVLIGYTGMPQGTGTLTEVADRVFRDGSDFGGINLQFMRDMIGDQQLGSGGMVTTFFCAFAAGILSDGDPDQQVMQDFYNDLGAQCLVPLFAIDPRDIATEECGANKLYGYNWDIGNLAAGTSGTIHLKLQIPSNAGAGMTFQNAAYLQMDGENQSEEGNEQTFSFVVVSNNNNGGGGSAGGGGSSSGPGNETDEKAGLCSVRDCSDSSYDDVCGVCNAEEIAESVVEKQEHATAPTSFVPDAATLAAYIQAVGDDIQGTTEQIAAFLFAKAAGLTTMADFATVRPFDGITRAEFSKLLVGFLENVLGRKTDGSRLRMCSQYNDVDSSLGDLELTIYKSCMHKVMGLQNDGNTPLDTFNPHEVMTRKYVVTTLSRVIWGNKYDNGDPFYVKHMQAMQDAGLVSLPDPEMPEQRMNAFTIMMRMAEQFDSLFE